MARTLKLSARVDTRDIQRDLRAIGDNLDQPITDVLGQGAEAIANAARGFMRHGKPPWPTSSGAKFEGGIASYYDSKVAHYDSRGYLFNATVGSTHPAAEVWEYGGHIDPAAGGGIHTVKRELAARARVRQKIRLAGGRQGFEIPRLMPVGHAADSLEAQIGQHLDDAVSRLVAQYGF